MHDVPRYLLRTIRRQHPNGMFELEEKRVAATSLNDADLAVAVQQIKSELQNMETRYYIAQQDHVELSRSHLHLESGGLSEDFNLSSEYVFRLHSEFDKYYTAKLHEDIL